MKIRPCQDVVTSGSSAKANCRKALKSLRIGGLIIQDEGGIQIAEHGSRAIKNKNQRKGQNMLLQFDFPKTFNDLLEDTIQTNYASSRESVPAMDIAEYENEYVAIVELPGVKKEDVKITFEKDVLTVEGARKPYEIPQDARVLLNEMRVREFRRSIRVPVEIDATAISAELENGILKVVLPKSQDARVRTIAIK